MKDYTYLVDKKYIRQRKSLIPEAVKFANKQFGRMGPGGKNIKANAEYAANWSRCFMAKIDRLYWELKAGPPIKGINDDRKTTT
jgi:hypothetical protein